MHTRFSMREFWLVFSIYILRKVIFVIPSSMIRMPVRGLASPRLFPDKRSIECLTSLLLYLGFLLFFFLIWYFVIFYLPFLLFHSNINSNPNSMVRDFLSLHCCLLLMHSPLDRLHHHYGLVALEMDFGFLNTLRICLINIWFKENCTTRGRQGLFWQRLWTWIVSLG